jgi:hypothetical protein
VGLLNFDNTSGAAPVRGFCSPFLVSWKSSSDLLLRSVQHSTAALARCNGTEEMTIFVNNAKLGEE